MKALFIATTILTLILGVSWLFFPQVMLGSWGVTGDAVTVYMSRRYGGLFFGYVAILWLARSATPSPTRTAILVGGTVCSVLMTFVSLLGALSHVVGPAVWGAVVVEAVLSVAFVYQLAADRRA